MDLFNTQACVIGHWQAKWNTPDSLHIHTHLTASDARVVALAENWRLSCPIREGCTYSSCLTRTPRAECVCCSWPYSSPYVSAGCTVRGATQVSAQQEISEQRCFLHLPLVTSDEVPVVCVSLTGKLSDISTQKKNREMHKYGVRLFVIFLLCPLLENCLHAAFTVLHKAHNSFDWC